MAIWRFMSTLMPVSGIFEDGVVNTFHLTTEDAEPNYIAVRGAWLDFMDAVRPYLSEDVRRTNHTLKAYNLSHPEPRAPVYDATWDLTVTPSSDALPSEVALCVSFQGARVSGEEQRRRRGRIYLGPFGVASITAGRPFSTMISDILTAFLDFITACNDGGWMFLVYSRSDEQGVEVTNVWIDDAFDTQRRRGVAPTTRSTEDIEQLVA